MSDTRVAMKTKVIVIVSGGCIRDIQTNDPTLDAIVVDYDCNEETPNTRIVDDNLADVWPVTLSPITLDV